MKLKFINFPQKLLNWFASLRENSHGVEAKDFSKKFLVILFRGSVSFLLIESKYVCCCAGCFAGREGRVRFDVDDQSLNRCICRPCTFCLLHWEILNILFFLSVILTSLFCETWQQQWNECRNGDRVEKWKFFRKIHVSYVDNILSCENLQYILHSFLSCYVFMTPDRIPSWPLDKPEIL